jgi:precorrin-6B methylase 1
VQGVNSFQQLVSKLKHCLETEFAITLVKQVLERRAQQIHHHHVEVILDAEIMNIAETEAVHQLAIDFVLMSQLWAPGTMPLIFNGHL